MPAYIRWPSGGGRTLHFTLVSVYAVRISKFEKMTKFLFLAQGRVGGEKVCAKLKITSRRRGGGRNTLAQK